jgi:hypothetical protein
VYNIVKELRAYFIAVDYCFFECRAVAIFSASHSSAIHSAFWTLIAVMLEGTGNSNFE